MRLARTQLLCAKKAGFDTSLKGVLPVVVITQGSKHALPRLFGNSLGQEPLGMIGTAPVLGPPPFSSGCGAGFMGYAIGVEEPH